MKGTACPGGAKINHEISHCPLRFGPDSSLGSDLVDAEPHSPVAVCLQKDRLNATSLLLTFTVTLCRPVDRSIADRVTCAVRSKKYQIYKYIVTTIFTERVHTVEEHNFA